MGARLSKQVSPWLTMVLASALAVAIAIPTRAAPAATPTPSSSPIACSAYSRLTDLTPEWNAGQTMSRPLTMMLADDGSAKLLFHQPLAATIQAGALAGTAQANSFLVFEVYHPRPWDFGPGHTLTVSSVDQAPPDLADYQPTDSVALQVVIPGKFYAPWQRRYFVIVECTNGAVSNWSLVAAHISNTKWSLGICAALAVLGYLCWTTAVWNRDSNLSTINRIRLWWGRKSRWYMGSPAIPRTDKRLLAQMSPAVTRAYQVTLDKSDAEIAAAAKAEEDARYLASSYPAIFHTPKLTWWQSLNPIHLTVNEFGEPSVQKFQVLMFSFLVAFLVLFVLLRTAALVNLSDTIVALMGISTVGAATAKIAYQQRTRLSFANWAWLQQRGVLNLRDKTRRVSWGDLTMTNREFDIYKMQTIVFSLVVAGALIIAGGSDLSTFTVPETLLGILGLSQVTYIGGVLVRPPAFNDLDDALTALRAAFDTMTTARDQKSDIDANGIVITPPPTGIADKDIAANATRDYCKLARNIVPMIESTLEVQVNKANLEPDPKTPCCFKTA